MTLAGGALLGWTGAAVIICAATIGATIVFVAAQTVLNEFFAKRSTGFMAKLEAGFHKNAFSYLLALRLIPAFPFWVVNIVPALLGMPPEPLCIGNIHWHHSQYINMSGLPRASISCCQAEKAQIYLY